MRLRSFLDVLLGLCTLGRTSSLLVHLTAQEQALYRTKADVSAAERSEILHLSKPLNHVSTEV